MGKYQQKPKQVEALKYDGSDPTATLAWAGANGNNDAYDFREHDKTMRLASDEDQTKYDATKKGIASPGDYIIVDEALGFYAIDGATFEAEYEELPATS